MLFKLLIFLLTITLATSDPPLRPYIAQLFPTKLTSLYSTTVPYTIYLHRLGNIVTIDFPPVQGTANGATANGVIANPIPSNYTSTKSRYFSVPVINNGGYITGCLEIDSNGNIIFWTTVCGSGYFTNNALAGWNQMTVSYTFVST